MLTNRGIVKSGIAIAIGEFEISPLYKQFDDQFL
jgi:hypothetical protein